MSTLTNGISYYGYYGVKFIYRVPPQVQSKTENQVLFRQQWGSWTHRVHAQACRQVVATLICKLIVVIEINLKFSA